MGRKRGTFFLIACFGVLLLAFSLASCSPGPWAYEGSLKKKTSIDLREGSEYFICFEDDNPDIRVYLGESTMISASARDYPTVDRIITIYNYKGKSPILNMISSGSLYAYFSSFLGSGNCGITVAKFRLEGKGRRIVQVYVNLDTYKEFADQFNKHRDKIPCTPYAPLVEPAPCQPNKIVIRVGGWVSF